MFTGVRPGGPRVHPVSLGSLGCALGVGGLIGGRWVHLGAPWCSSGSSGVAGFTGVGPGCCRIYPGCAQGVVGFTWCRWVHWGALWVFLGRSGVDEFTGVRPGDCRMVAEFTEMRPLGRRVHQVSQDSFRCALFVVGSLVRWVAP